MKYPFRLRGHRLIDGLCGERFPAIDLAHMIWLEASNAQNSMAAVSADGRTVSFGALPGLS
jgi:hypothetical protein